MNQPKQVPESYRAYLRLLVSKEALVGVGEKLDASDIVQETLLRAYKFQDQFKGTTDNEYQGWLRRIMANIIASSSRHYRLKKRNVQLERTIHAALDRSSLRICNFLADLGPSPSDRLADEEAATELLHALSELPSDQQQAISLRYFSGTAVADIAAEMQKSEAAVAGLLRRGLATLRNTLAGK